MVLWEMIGSNFPATELLFLKLWKILLTIFNVSSFPGILYSYFSLFTYIQVANFEYVDEAELAAEEETPVPAAENRASVNNSERASYWEDLLRDKFEVQKIEEFNSMGKGKRSRKQVFFVAYYIYRFGKFKNKNNFLK